MGTKVLLVGINTYPRMPLRGCINDIENMRALLGNQYQLGDEALQILRDDEATTAAIEDKLRWLAQPDDGDGPPVRLFHFSGHGTYVVDRNGDEPDGRDEALVPYDYNQSGAMTDDALRDVYNQFAPETHLLLTMDCCHSGTITRNAAEDITYRFLPNSLNEQLQFDEAAQRVQAERNAYIREQLRDLRGQSVSEDEWDRRFQEAATRFDKKHFGVDKLRGNVVLIAACRADQTAADARIGGNFTGAFTYYLTEVLRERGQGITYHDLIGEVGQRLYANHFLQVPQLECSAANQECNFINITL